MEELVWLFGLGGHRRGARHLFFCGGGRDDAKGTGELGGRLAAVVCGKEFFRFEKVLAWLKRLATDKIF